MIFVNDFRCYRPSLAIASPMRIIARIIAPGYPHHIIHRGNNRITVFFEDRQTYLKLLTGYATRKVFGSGPTA